MFNFLSLGFFGYDTYFYLAWAFLILGIIGAVLPVLPGPPLSWIGLLFGYLSENVQIAFPALVVSFIICAVITIIDYICPTYITKKTGGTKAGTKGATLGLIIGLFAGPMGVIVGPFAGALIGETLHNKNNYRQAMKSAGGAFLGFICGTGLKLICDVIIIVFFWQCIGTVEVQSEVNSPAEVIQNGTESEDIPFDQWWTDDNSSNIDINTENNVPSEEVNSISSPTPSESINEFQDSMQTIILGVLNACDTKK